MFSQEDRRNACKFLLSTLIRKTIYLYEGTEVDRPVIEAMREEVYAVASMMDLREDDMMKQLDRINV